MAKTKDVVAQNISNKTSVNAEVVKSSPVEAKKQNNATDVKNTLVVQAKSDIQQKKVDVTNSDSTESDNKAALDRNSLYNESLAAIRKKLGIEETQDSKNVEQDKKSDSEDDAIVEAKNDISADASDDKVEQDNSSVEKPDEVPVDDKKSKGKQVEQDEKQDDAIITKAKDEGIDPELAKDYAVKKLLKRLNSEVSKRKELESKQKQYSSADSQITGESVEQWTEEYARDVKSQYQRAIANAEDILDTELKRDDDGNEIPVEANGRKFTRKELRSAVRQLKEEYSSIDAKVEKNKQFAAERESWQAKAMQRLSWYGDDNDPIALQGAQALDIVKKNGIQNTPFAEYIFALGWDAYAKDYAAEEAKKSGKEVDKLTTIKKVVPKTTTPSASGVAPKSIVAQNKKDEIEVLREKAEGPGGTPEDMQKYRAAVIMKRYNGS